LNALQWAALMGNSAQVRDLLLLGEDVDEVGQIINLEKRTYHMTPLCLAAAHGNEATVKLLLSAGAVIGYNTPIVRGPHAYYAESALKEAKDAHMFSLIADEAIRRRSMR
jgi:ankyrin repeat protein